MRANFRPELPGDSRPHEQRPWCAGCDTDSRLAVESIEACYPGEEAIVDVAYSCVACDRFYAHPAAFDQVAAILNRPGRIAAILQFGREYIHCGEPMKIAGSETGATSTSIAVDPLHEGTLDVYLRTRVLHCHCGFQMEIPD
jgi:hypothetical protein